MKFNKLIIFSIMTLTFSSEMYAPPAARPRSQGPGKPATTTATPTKSRPAPGSFQQVKPSGATPTQSLSSKFQNGLRVGSKPNQTATTTKSTQSIQLDQPAQKPAKTKAEKLESMRKSKSPEMTPEQRVTTSKELASKSSIVIKEVQKGSNRLGVESNKPTSRIKETAQLVEPKSSNTKSLNLTKPTQTSKTAPKQDPTTPSGKLNTKSTSQSRDPLSPTSTSTSQKPVTKTTVQGKIKEYYKILKKEYNVLKAKITGKDVVVTKTLSDGTFKRTTTKSDGSVSKDIATTKRDGSLRIEGTTTFKNGKKEAYTGTKETNPDGSTVKVINKTLEDGRLERTTTNKSNSITKKDIETMQPDGSTVIEGTTTLKNGKKETYTGTEKLNPDDSTVKVINRTLKEGITERTTTRSDGSVSRDIATKQTDGSLKIEGTTTLKNGKQEAYTGTKRTNADGLPERVMNKKIEQTNGTIIENKITTVKDPKVSGETWTTNETITKKNDGTTIETTSYRTVDRANQRIDLLKKSTITRPDGSQLSTTMSDGIGTSANRPIKGTQTKIDSNRQVTEFGLNSNSKK